MKRFLLIVIGAALLQSCFFDEPTDDETVVLLEDVIYVSSNDVRLLGRIFSMTENATDHGFEFSEDESFSNPQSVSLGAKNDVGLFFAEYKLLKENTPYYYRAYVNVGGSVMYSEVNTLSTFEAGVTGVSALFGEPGDNIEIIGTNFTNDLEVFFDQQSTNITSRKAGYLVEVEVPESQGNVRVPLFLDFDGRKVLIDTFEYQSGVWTRLEDIPHTPVNNGVIKKSEDHISLFLGADADGNKNKEIHKFYPATNSWVSSPLIADSKFYSEGAFYTASGIFGSGADSILTGGFDIYYSLTQNLGRLKDDGTVEDLGVSQKIGYKSIAVEHNDALYVLGGNPGNDRIFKYDADGWSIAGTLPFTVSNSSPYVLYEDKIFIFNTNDENIWYFDLTTNTLEMFVQLSINLQNGSSFFLVDKFIVFGVASFQKSIWQLNLETGSLIGKNDFPGDQFFSTNHFFEFNGDLFISRISNETASTETEFWKFQPFELK